MPRLLAQGIAVSCFTWIGVWVVWGATDSGHAWYQKQVIRIVFWLGFSNSSSDHIAKTALPLLVLALPILLAGTAAALLGSIIRPTTHPLDQEQQEEESLSLLHDGAGDNEETLKRAMKTTRTLSVLQMEQPRGDEIGQGTAPSYQQQIPIHHHYQPEPLLSQKHQKLQTETLIHRLTNHFRRRFYCRVNDDKILFWIMFVVPISLFTIAFIHRHTGGGAVDAGEETDDAFTQTILNPMAKASVAVSFNDDDGNDDGRAGVNGGVAVLLTSSENLALRLTLSTTNAGDGAGELKRQANAFGFASLIALSLLLIPVARYSPLLAVLGWPPSRAIVFHRWMGFVAVVGVLLHGGLHCYRWWLIRSDEDSTDDDATDAKNTTTTFVGVLWNRIAIPSDCWNDWNIHHPQGHYCRDGGCTCNRYSENLTGCLAVLVFLILMMFSLEPIRRRMYHIFYAVHIVAAPLALVLTILHWKGSILYLAGGLLYYLASSMPVFVETSRIYFSTPKMSVSLLSAELLDDEEEYSPDERSCVGLTFEVTPTARDLYQAGQYVRLWVPEISREAHPFTILSVLNPPTCPSNMKDDHPWMRIIFRQTGRFTKELGRRLMLQSSRPPKVYMDGFHGCCSSMPTTNSNRWNKLRKHDFVMIAAGGIGITPYLSLLGELCNINDKRASRDTTAKSSNEGSQKQMATSGNRATTTIRQVIQLHWVCRDRGLIEYVQREYLNHIVAGMGITTGGRGGGGLDDCYEIFCTVHYTGSLSLPTAMNCVLKEEEDCHDDDDEDSENDLENGEFGRGGAFVQRGRKQDFVKQDFTEPFHPSKFAVGLRSTYQGNFPTFLSFVLIGGFGLMTIWIICTHQSTTQTQSSIPAALVVRPLMALLFLLGLGAVVGVLVNQMRPDAPTTRYNATGVAPRLTEEKETTYTFSTRTNEDSACGTDPSKARLLESNRPQALRRYSTLSTVSPSSSFSSCSSCDLEVAPTAPLPDTCVRILDGRPDFPTLFSESLMDTAEFPAVLVCGPKALIQSVCGIVRAGAGDRHPRQAPISIYEEVFEL